MFFFWSHPRCFGPLGKFQHNIKISIKTARVSRLCVSYDYGRIKTWDAQYCCLNPNYNLTQVINITVIEKSIQSFIHKFSKCFFKYLITGRLDNSYYNLILNPSWKQQLLLQFWVPTEKTQVIKKWLNTYANWFEISFFRRNNIL